MFLNKMCGKLDPINTSPSQLAIEGFDPVAYFTEAKAVMGYSDFPPCMDGGHMAVLE